MALDERRRKFVIFFVHGGYTQTEAARAAGYEQKNPVGLRVAANKLMRQRAVLAAMREETERHLDGIGVRAVRRLGKLIDSKKEGAALRAVDSALDRTGFPRRTEQLVAVRHSGPRRSAEELVGAVLEKLRAHMVALPAPIDVEFSEVSRETVEKADVEQAVEVAGVTIHNDGS